LTKLHRYASLDDVNRVKKCPRPHQQKTLSAAEEKILADIRRTSKLIRDWRHSGSELLTRDRLAAVTGRCMGTVQNWERDRVEPRVSDVRAMEQERPGLVERLFPRAFRMYQLRTR
jgi:DNA-binding transcriptional regulator YiaG